MPKTVDRVQDTSTTTGTGAFTVSGTPPTGYQAFGSVFSVGDTFYYAITQTSGGLWEVGMGTLTTSTTFSRDTVLDGSSGPGTLVSFASASTVFCDLPSYAVKRGRWGITLAQQYNWVNQ